MAEDEVEAIAQALYGTQECARGWAREPEPIKERFRDAARAAINVFDEHREITTRDIAPLVVAQELSSARDFLMNSSEVSVLSVPSFRAFRTVMSGPDLSVDAANEPLFRLVGRRDLVGLPVREAFPELKGQGYFELLAQVYQTRKPFMGRMMPILFQPRKGAPLEEHITDFIYRPIENVAGQVTGLFVEGYDRTEWARA
jgi:PAS fold